MGGGGWGGEPPVCVKSCFSEKNISICRPLKFLLRAFKYSFRDEFVNTSSRCAPDKPDIGESGKCPLFAFRAPGRRGWGPSPGTLTMLTGASGDRALRSRRTPVETALTHINIFVYVGPSFGSQ